MKKLLLLLSLLPFISYGQEEVCTGDDGLCVVQFNAAFNSANEVKWLEDLTDEFLDTHFKYVDEANEVLTRNDGFKPYSIRYETYFGKELPIIKAKFKEVYETTFKPYGYVVD